MSSISGFSEAIGRDGFASVSGPLNLAEVTALAKRLQQSQLRRSRAGVRHAMQDESVAAIAHDDRLANLARDVLGKAAFPFRATLFEKSPDSNWLVVWHQDTALPLGERCEAPGWGPWSIKNGIHYAHAPASALEQVLAQRLHLDDSSADNGPLRVLPATHTLGVLSDEQLYDLSKKIAPADCLVPAGGVVAMRPLIVHASSKSQSERSRRVLHIEYAAARSIADGLELAIA
jgi:ectoine hydroxylase-related dioxygenase (phytanoyl-CoA dioxygenase family)